MFTLLPKVLSQKKSRWQITGASVGVLVGLFLLLLSLQFYLDTNTLMRGAKDNNLLVINKRMSVFNTLGAPSEFSKEEIEALRSKPYIQSVGEFVSNGFQASLSASSLGFYTLLFLQTVPNTYLGVDTSEFRWKAGDDYVPLILSSDYLSLYNYGFAPSQGLPPFTASTISQLSGELKVYGKGKARTLRTSIVGLSPNINSILVPKSFMDYANAEFGEQMQPINQLVLSVDNPYSKDLNDFLATNNYEISRGGLIGGELKTVLDILLLFIAAISVIIIGLSLLVFILNFQLLVAQSSGDIQLLLQIGYTDTSISSTLARSLLRLFAIVALGAFALLIPIKYFVSQSLVAQGYSTLSLFLSPLVWLVGIAFCALFIAVNYRSIRTSVRKLAL